MRFMETSRHKWRWTFRWYDALLGLAIFCLILGLLPDGVYLHILVALGPSVESARLHALPGQMRLFMPMMVLASAILWWGMRKTAPEFQMWFDMRPRILALLFRLHVLIIVPTVAYWLFYGVYWWTASEAQWKQEIRLVPWHRDLSDAIARLRQRIPEEASLLLILERRGTSSYAAYFNAALYPRRVYVYRRQPGRVKVTRAEVDVNRLRQLGIDWIVTYRGPHEFHLDQLSVEPLRE